MSILSLKGYTAGINSNNYCPSCGRTSSTVANIGQSYATSSGRSTSGDSYICESCQSGNTSKSINTTYSAKSSTTSRLCPLCTKQTGINDPHWSNNNGRTVTSKSISNNSKSNQSTVSRTTDSFR
ncbi:MAG: hypothetical protein LBE18_09460 [Planctomycetaceae bacterium]|nr:hypothetical protein [Planctomycetaceae bacterium]